MAVFQSPIGNAAALELPAAADDGHGIGSRPAALLQAVEGKASRAAWSHIGKLLHLEIFRPLLEFHEIGLFAGTIIFCPVQYFGKKSSFFVKKVRPNEKHDLGF